MKHSSRQNPKRGNASVHGRRIITQKGRTHRWATSRPSNSPLKWHCKNRLHKATNKLTNSPNGWRRVGSQVTKTKFSLAGKHSRLADIDQEYSQFALKGASFTITEICTVKSLLNYELVDIFDQGLEKTLDFVQ